MNDFNPHEGPKKKKVPKGQPDYNEAYLFLIGYLQTNMDKMFEEKDWNFIRESLIENCGM